jgi:hypothetical protein
MLHLSRMVVFESLEISFAQMLEIAMTLRQ